MNKSELIYENHPQLTFHSKPDFTSFVAFDFETTGLNPVNDCIIEIGAVKVENGMITDKFSKTVRPFNGKKISPFITALTGITQKQVDISPEIDEVLPEFAEFCEDYILIGYNNKSFDNKFLINAAVHCNMTVTNMFFDVLLLARQNKNYPGEKCSLSDSCAKYSVINEKAHGAYYDAKATAEIYIKIHNILYEKNNILNIQK